MVGQMTPPNTRPIRSPAVGAKIESLCYDAESGYVVIELENGEELWVSADSSGYHVLHSSADTEMTPSQFSPAE